ncbi:3792_t:CDS:2 [Cetraspora pellucida]|uniref:3792_t:CDS:1 n=1 Tax=Cetraspora pellucida TaxID=1433469 RepID=A0A9N9AD98_9GLOM|nr:3792_t:CDS:2 [Cetraspora pellucida]
MSKQSQKDHQGELISAYLQKKAQDFINDSYYKLDNNICTLRLQNKNLRQENTCLTKYKTIADTKIQSLSVRLARAKQNKQKQISKIRAAIHRAKQIQPAQFQHAVDQLFKVDNKEYNARFVKLATDISNIGQTFIHATVECTKAFYQFLTGEMPQQWITPSTLA